jgi:hypothetical protein
MDANVIAACIAQFLEEIVRHKGKEIGMVQMMR